jgi:hypothetical protein
MDRQVVSIAKEWEGSRKPVVARGVNKLATDPREGLAELRHVGHGCRWLLSRWAEYQSGLATYGYWPAAVWPDVVRTLGCDPHPDRIKDGGTRVFRAVVYNLLSQPAPDEELIIELLAPERMPADVRRDELVPPTPAAARTWLQQFVAKEIDELQRLELSLRLGKDRADLESVLEKASLLRNNAASKAYRRYHGEANSKFLRTFDKLPKELQRGATGFYDELAAAAGTDDDEPPPDPPDSTPVCPGEGGPGAPGVRADAPPLSPWERVEGRVRASAPPTTSEPESGPSCDDHTDRGPEPASSDSPAESVVEQPVPVASAPSEKAGPGVSESSEIPGGALPAAAELPLEESVTGADYVVVPDGPRCNAEAPGQVEATGSDSPAARPPHRGWAVIGIPSVAGDHAVPVPRVRAGPEEEGPQPGDRAPPGLGRDSPQARDGSPQAVP